MQEARSKFFVETEPSVSIEPLDGSLDLEGSCNIHFKRSSPSASMGRIYCKVQFAIKFTVRLITEIRWSVVDIHKKALHKWTNSEWSS